MDRINSKKCSSKRLLNTQNCSGFALIASLSIMSMLVLIAVALFSLSSVATKSASVATARTEAQANAKMAMMIAVGELQKNLGPDRAITATSDIRATSSSAVAKPNTAGVWESWNFLDPANPNASLDYTAEKTNRFRRWLVSTSDIEAAKNLAFVDSAWGANESIELVGDGTLGSSAPDEDKVFAGRVPVSQSEPRGSYAWHVADESTKARINLYRDPSENTTLAQKRALNAGHRPDATVIMDFEGNPLSFLPSDKTATDFAEATATMGKVINLDEAELLDNALGKIMPLRHDVTLYSLGVLADARNGGLKKDLSSVFEMGSATANTLPSQFTNRKLYDSTLGITGVSDPNWSALAGYYNSFRNLTTPETDPTFTLQPSAASFAEVPEGFNPAPVITKVETIFSLVGRPLTDIGWLASNPNWDICANLIFTPVVTLHNPYNVNISFNKMQVNFTNIPVAFNYMLLQEEVGQFASQGVVPGTFESLNTMNYRNSSANPNRRTDKVFGITIGNWSDDSPLDPNDPWSDSVDGPIILKPGQTLVCGPSLPANASFYTDARSGGNAVGFDWENDLTQSIKAKPEFTPGLGFELTGVCINHMRSGAFNGANYGSWCWFLMLRDQNTNPKISQSTTTDEFYLEFKLQQPFWYIDDSTLETDEADPTFEVTALIQPTESDTPVDFARLRFDYQNTSTLGNKVDDQVYRYPPTGSLTATDIVAPGGTQYNSQYTYVQPFAIFSAYTRTTRGGVYEDNTRDSSSLNLLKDGRLAGKPFLFHNPSRTNFSLDLSSEKPGIQAYELNLQPFLSKGNYEDYFDVDASNRVPSLSGNKSTTGIKSGSYLEVPSGPLQTLADFRRSNALSTSYLPHFVQPLGNSLLHPLMSANLVVETNSDISDDELMDHSVLANHALYDRFYFSTFSTRGSETPDAVFEQFMDSTTPLPSQAFEPYLPNGKTATAARTELFASNKPRNEAFLYAAEYQMIQGPFNVNSTRVEAWKAVLSAMNKSEITALLTSSGLVSNAATGVPITAMSLPNGEAILGAGYAERSTGWNGYRDLTEMEVATLAENIVEEVRARGPFLSMSEFVNRQVGPSGPLTLSGALEVAIAKAEINEVENATSADSFLRQVPITADDLNDTDIYAYKTPEATTGNPAVGAPGWVSQGDLLRILGPAATVRGDTFVIRVYGDSQSPSGEVAARAYAEAVLQRVPEYLNPSDRPSLDPPTESENENFGRRFEMVSFRWLSENEI